MITDHEEYRKEIVRILKEYEDELLYEPCQCGCPEHRQPKNRAALAIIRLLKAMPECYPA